MSNCENRTYTVEDMAKMLNIGISAAYNLTKDGYFKIVRIGNAIRISKIRCRFQHCESGILLILTLFFQFIPVSFYKF